jgi:hypothetical protein
VTSFFDKAETRKELAHAMEKWARSHMGCVSLGTQSITDMSDLHIMGVHLSETSATVSQIDGLPWEKEDILNDS